MQRAVLLICLGAVGCGGGSFEVGPSPGVTDEDAAVLPEANPADTADEALTDTEARSDAAADVELDTSVSADADASDSTIEDVSDSTSADAALDGDAMGSEVLSDVSIDAAADAKCEAPVTCWVDADGDGYAAAAAASVVTCSCPMNTTARSPEITIDCNDEDSRVRPGATAFYTEPYCVPGTGCATKSFDYDCSGVHETQLGTALFGGCAAGSCVGAGGWTSSAPACGESASWTSCKLELLVCQKPTFARAQACR